MLPGLIESAVIRYTLEICLSIPIFLTFSVLKAGGMRKTKLGGAARRIPAFLGIFAMLLALSGLLSGIAAVVIYTVVHTEATTGTIIEYISWASALITCLIYPIMAGFFVSLSEERKNFVKEAIRLAGNRYAPLCISAFVAYALGYGAAQTGNKAVETIISVLAGALCITFSLGIIFNVKEQKEQKEE